MTNLDDRLREAAGSLAPSGETIPPFKGVQQRARRRRMIGATGAVVVVLAVAFATVSTTRDSDKVIVANSVPTSTTLAPSTTTTGTTLAPAVLNDVTVYLVANEHLVTAGRKLEGSVTPESAVRALLAGPVGTTEGDLGFASAIPAGTELHSVTVDGPEATVDLSSQFASGGGSLSMQLRVAQVVFTVTQFAPIDHVRFRIDGSPVSSIGGEGVMVDNVDRASFANVTPLILVESPTPNEAVRAPLHVRGMSNTFEATVNYTLVDANGTVLDEGFTTATSGTGTWGTFEFDIAFGDYTGLGRLSVYEASAKDGARINETTIPLHLQP